MPPRAVKKTPTGPGMKRATRTTRGTPKSQNQPDVHEEPVKVEEAPVEVKVRVSEEKQHVELNASSVSEPDADADVDPEEEAMPEPDVDPEEKAKDNGIGTVRKEDEVKESVDEYENGEQLDLEDNEPEYEHEEYNGLDYDEKEVEHEEVDEEEEIEVYEGDDGEGDMVEEEIEDVHEELEGVDEEHATVEHAEEEAHHEVVKERRKRKEFEVFVGGLDKDASEDDLRKVFSQVGEVVEVRLMMNPQTKKNKGFAFLRFATVEQAKRACTELKSPMVNGKQCGVSPSQDSDTLFLGNICKTWTKEALKEKLKHYGLENIEDLTLVEDSNNSGLNRGFAFIEFSSRSDAMDAFKRLQRRDVVFGVDRPAKVSFADSFIDPGDEIMAQVKTVFIDGLPPSWDEDRVRELLKKYGRVEKIELARNMPSAKRKDFGFITFDSHDAAVLCAKSINNEELGEGDNKAKVRARLSRPLQRGKGRHAGRGDLWPGRGTVRSIRGPWVRPFPRPLSGRGARGVGRRTSAVDHSLKRPVGIRERRQAMAVPPRERPLPHLSRSYDRRPPVASYPKSGMKRDYGRHEGLPPRSRPAIDYSSRVVPERRISYRDEYLSRGSGYPDVPKSSPRVAARRPQINDGYGQRFERPSGYREGRGREYDTISGSKRPYASMDDPGHYAETGIRPSRARLDYELSGSASQYGDAYGDRLSRSNVGYGGGRSSLSGHDSTGLYSSRHGMGYSGGTYGGNATSGMYSSSFGGDYVSRGGDAGGGSYSSLYSSRSFGGGSSYMGGGSSASYY